NRRISSSFSNCKPATLTGARVSSSNATIVKYEVLVCLTNPNLKSSDTTLIPTSIELVPTYFTEAYKVNNSPTSTGFIKATQSTEAVTQYPLACEAAQVYSILSINDKIPPPSTLPPKLAYAGTMSS